MIPRLRCSSIMALAAALASLCSPAQAAAECISQDSPNPIGAEFPSVSTGNLNGTNIIIPIPLDEARRLIPAGLNILEGAYRAWLPDFPKGKYPMMAVAVHDHDVGLHSAGFKLPDFSRSGFEFPFIDLLGDGYSSFRWAGTMMITNGSLAVEGSKGFGVNVVPATFDPPCDAYKGKRGGVATFEAHQVDGPTKRLVKFKTKPFNRRVPYSLDFLRNVTNQPVFSTTPGVCDNYERHFDTVLSKGPFEPVPVMGVVSGKLEPFKKKKTWLNVYGWRLSTAFTEPIQPAKCEDLKGFHVVVR